MLSFIVAALTMTIASVSAEQVPKCYGDSYGNLADTIIGTDYCTFPIRKINAECVAASCPDLTKDLRCPIKSDGEIDTVNVEKTLRIINECLRKPTICDVPLNPIPVPYLIMNANTLLTGTTLSGICHILDKQFFITNMSDTVVSVADVTQQKLVISIGNTDLIYDGNVSCKFQSDALSRVFNKPFELELNNLVFKARLQIQTYITETFKGIDSASQIGALVATITPEITGLNFGILSSIFDGVANVFLSFVESYAQNSDLPRVYAEFIKAIVDNAFEVTRQKC